MYTNKDYIPISNYQTWLYVFFVYDHGWSHFSLLTLTMKSGTNTSVAQVAQ
jgi:hypothetical protein